MTIETYMHIYTIYVNLSYTSIYGYIIYIQYIYASKCAQINNILQKPNYEWSITTTKAFNPYQANVNK